MRAMLLLYSTCGLVQHECRSQKAKRRKLKVLIQKERKCTTTKNLVIVHIVLSQLALGMEGVILQLYLIPYIIHSSSFHVAPSCWCVLYHWGSCYFSTISNQTYAINTVGIAWTRTLPLVPESVTGTS